MSKTLHVAVLEPYYGGSHAAFVDAVKLHSRHRITLVTMPARKWKWRMRGAAIWFAKDANDWLRKNDRGPADVILANDMLSIADLRALLPADYRNIPIICYFHENQLTYPIPDEQERDYQYGMTNITSCLAADAVWFNSRFHLESFLAAAEELLDKMPDYVPREALQEIRSKADVLPPPVDAGRTRREAGPPNQPMTILWCHRWEYDKNPEPFFNALIHLDEEGYAFHLVMVGEQFRTAPSVFANVRNRLQSHIVHAGFLPERAAYLSMLSRCDVVVSTAIQENFGIAVVEAILAGCQPLLPSRMVYPELIPAKLLGACLYPYDADLYEHLRALIDGHAWLSPAAADELQSTIESEYGVSNASPRLDDGLATVVDRCSQ